MYTFLFLSLLAVVIAVESGFQPTQIHLSQWYKSSSMAVMWHTGQRTHTSNILYHRGRCKDQISTSNFNSLPAAIYTYGTYEGWIHMGVIDNLKPSETYCYQVGDSTHGYSAAREFSTPDPEKVVIAAYADTGTWGNIDEVMPALTMDEDSTMVLHVGDLSYAQDDAVWETWGNLFEPVASRRPYMIIPGNWDVKPFAIEAWQNRFSMPLYQLRDRTLQQWATRRTNIDPKQPLYYYSFDYGPCRVIMMSSYDTYTPGSAQYAWLETELIAASQPSARAVRPFVIVAFHSPMYSSSTGHNGSDMDFRNAIESLLHKYKVDLTLTGHDHGYERTFPVFNGTPLEKGMSRYINPAGTIHILVGTGGASADPWLPEEEWTAIRESTWGYTRVTAMLSTPDSNHASLHVLYRHANGTIGDEFTILKDKVAGPALGGLSPFTVISLIVLAFVVLPWCTYKVLYKRGLFRGKSQSTNTTPVWSHTDRGFKGSV